MRRSSLKTKCSKSEWVFKHHLLIALMKYIICCLSIIMKISDNSELRNLLGRLSWDFSTAHPVTHLWGQTLVLNDKAWFPSKSIPKFFLCLCTDVLSCWNRKRLSQAVPTMLRAWNCPNSPGTLTHQSQLLNNSPTSSPPSNKLVLTYNSNTNRHIRFAFTRYIPHDLVPPIGVATNTH